MSEQKNIPHKTIDLKSDESTFTQPVFWITIAVALAIVSALGFALYHFITERVIDSSLQTSEELALHDEAFIDNSLELRFDSLRGIAKELSQTKAENMTELLDLLRKKEFGIDCIDLLLLSDQGDFYNGSLLIYKDQSLRDICLHGGDQFVARYDSNTVAGEQHKQCLVFGIKIKPFTVDGVTFDYLLSRLSLDTLANELKIDSYDGQGFSSVIDRDGNYIVNMSGGAVVSERDNFYQSLADAHLNDGATIEGIRDSISKDKSFTISLEKNNDTIIMQFTPMQNYKWYFITSVPRSVFERQSMDILQIVLVTMGILLLAVLAAFFLLLRNREDRRRASVEAAYSKELSEALDMAEKANRAKTVFLSSMSHDIRTPMNAIIGFANLAEAKVDDPEKTRDYLLKIQQSSEHLLSLINDVLDMSRIESGKVELDEEPADLAQMIDGVCAIIQNQIAERDQKFVIEIDPDAQRFVYVDKLRLNQVLLNILSNAMKYTPEGGEITLQAQQIAQEAGGGTYRVVVSDTGIGMSPEFAATIFDSFTREQTSTVSGIQGTGLGMAITKNIIDLMKGTIEVDTAPGEGSTFTITFTLRQVTDPAELAKLKDAAQPQAEKDAGSQSGSFLVANPDEFMGLRLLLADDNLLSRELAKEILEEAGFTVDTVEDGAQEVEAIKTCDPGYYDVVLSDVQMPVMDGHEAARTIRALDDPDRANIPIIACTANAFEEDVQAALDAGMNAHIGKPINIDKLIETLGSVLSTHETMTENEEGN